jgi:hypothetical protein
LQPVGLAQTLQIYPGNVIDSTSSVMIYSPTTATKDISKLWAPGTSNGCLVPLSGTVAITNGLMPVTGSGTSFIADFLNATDLISGSSPTITTANGNGAVTAATPGSNTSMTLTSGFAGTTGTGLAYAFLPQDGEASVFIIRKDSDASVDFMVTPGGPSTITPPAGYTYYALIGHLTFSGGNVSYNYSQRPTGYSAQPHTFFANAGGSSLSPFPVFRAIASGDLPAGTFVTAATKSDQQAASSATLAVTPLHQGDHPSAIKVRGKAIIASLPALATSYNIASIVKTTTGEYKVTLTTPFATADYEIFAFTEIAASGVAGLTATVKAGSQAAGSFSIWTLNTSGVLSDPVVLHVHCTGTQ